MARGLWLDPTSGQVTLSAYMEEWLAAKVALRTRTLELYRSNINRHIAPELGAVKLTDLSPTIIRRWHAGLASSGLAPATTAKVYRLLSAILATAVADEIVVRNPCVVKSAGVERSPERPIATVNQVYALAALWFLTAAFTGLRWGELAGLQRRRVDLLHGVLRVEHVLVESEGGLSVGPPKTEAGRRSVAIPPPLVPVLENHMSGCSAPGPDGLVFCGPLGAALRRTHFGRKWRSAVRMVGDLEGLHFHDLRHTANTLTATTGASTRELMYRMGHASPAAALRYQHATRDRDAAIAQALGELLEGGGKVVPMRRATSVPQAAARSGHQR